jgi:YidC/Oxa1 family membrane protein insertase
LDRFFGFIIHPMELGLIWLAVTVGNAGIAIILFTIFVRLVLAPLQITQLRNAKQMQKVQPLIQELRKKHGKDKQAFAAAQMELFKEHKVNPAMGCLPMVVQIPILIGLFYALLHLGASPTGWPHVAWAKANIHCNGVSIHNMGQWFQQCYAVSGVSGTTSHIFDLFHANFLWLNHGLGSPDPLYILPILAGVTQWIQSRMMLTQSNDPQQQMMNTMTNFFPLMIVFFATRYPSGLSLYWVTSTLIGIAIQYKITGTGLLKIPDLGSLGNLAQAFGAQQPRPGSGPSRNGRPKRDGGPKPPTPPQTEPNGSDGEATASQPMTKVTQPRKKANRARGGRSGGRRG